MVVRTDTLDLVLKHKWFDMIASGEKNEEYRDITPHWTQRIAGRCSSCQEKGTVKWCLRECDGLKYDQRMFCKYKRVRFHRGYTSTTITRTLTGLEIGFGDVTKGAPANRRVYILKLGQVVGCSA